MIEFNNFVGRQFSEVAEELRSLNIKHRVWKWDGDLRLLTRDYNPDRFNFAVENNIIKEVHRG